MLQFTHGRNTPAMSNTERQRQFRERNPGYYGRLHRKRNAACNAFAAMQAARAAALAQPVPVALPIPAPMLMLPAPVETTLFADLFTFAIPQRERELVPISREAA